MLNDAVKKGGVMASSSVGGLSGAFIPVSEDAGMIRAAEDGALSLEKLEAMTCVCSVGLDMIAVPGDTSVETIFGIIADELRPGHAREPVRRHHVRPPRRPHARAVELAEELARQSTSAFPKAALRGRFCYRSHSITKRS